jgi:hypothetical protein
MTLTGAATWGSCEGIVGRRASSATQVRIGASLARHPRDPRVRRTWVWAGEEDHDDVLIDRDAPRYSTIEEVPWSHSVSSSRSCSSVADARPAGTFSPGSARSLRTRRCRRWARPGPRRSTCTRFTRGRSGVATWLQAVAAATEPRRWDRGHRVGSGASSLRSRSSRRSWRARSRPLITTVGIPPPGSTHCPAM